MKRRIQQGENWAIALAGLIANANDGDTIVVHSYEMLDSAERARRRVCPDKRLMFEVEEEERDT